MEAEDIARIHRIVADHFNSRAEIFDSEPTHGFKSEAMREGWHDRVADWIGDAPKDVLDAGCGTGFFALAAAELGHRATGIDIASDMIATAQRKAATAELSATFVTGDVTRSPSGDGSFDVVLDRHLLWTLPEPEAAAAEFYRLLRPGGRWATVIVDWRKDAFSDEAAKQSKTHHDYLPVRHHLPFYGGRPKEDVMALFADAGFVDLGYVSLHDDVYWHDGRGRDRFAIIGSRPA